MILFVYFLIVLSILKDTKIAIKIAIKDKNKTQVIVLLIVLFVYEIIDSCIKAISLSKSS